MSEKIENRLQAEGRGLGTEFTPREIVTELDRYVIGQEDAKKAIAIALRNRWRRLSVEDEIRDEISPKNIIMIGPTGVGKTEISRRLARLAKAPFVKVEASKFTEVGYVGRDVESIIRDLAEVSYNLVKEEERGKVRAMAESVAEEKLLDILLPPSTSTNVSLEVSSEQLQENSTREKLRKLLQEGKLEERIVELETVKAVSTHLEIVGPPGLMEIEGQIKEMFSNIVPKSKEKKKITVKEARVILIKESQDSLIDHEIVSRTAIRRAEESGIVFIDEIDKICGAAAGGRGPDVSREGVQRDLLPLVEGCSVGTKYGTIRTDRVLFIASGAFHISKPSDLMPEFQGRFPIRVELKSLNAEHFVRILTEPKNALVRQYQALLKTEEIDLRFDPEAIKEIASLTAEVNARTENIGARRLHTLLEKLLEDLSFNAQDFKGQTFVVDRSYVQKRLAEIVQDVDLARFIL